MAYEQRRIQHHYPLHADSLKAMGFCPLRLQERSMLAYLVSTCSPRRGCAWLIALTYLAWVHGNILSVANPILAGGQKAKRSLTLNVQEARAWAFYIILTPITLRIEPIFGLRQAGFARMQDHVVTVDLPTRMLTICSQILIEPHVQYSESI